MDSHGGTCQYIVMIGLFDIDDEYGSDWLENTDHVKESIMRKVLNINNHISVLCSRHKTKQELNNEKTSSDDKKFDQQISLLSSKEFFIYSVSVALNTKKNASDNLDDDGERKEGDGVCVITAKLPRENNRQRIYTRLMQRLTSPKSVVLKIHREDAETMRSKTQFMRGILPFCRSRGPDIFNTNKEGNEENKGNYFAFFSQTSLLLIKKDDDFAVQRLKMEKARAAEQHKAGTNLLGFKLCINIDLSEKQDFQWKMNKHTNNIK